MMCFLEVEKENRFTAVRQPLRDMQRILHNLVEEPAADDSAPMGARRNLSDTVDAFFAMSHLRIDGLVSWRDQLALLKARMSGEDGQARGTEEKEMVGYLEQLIARYDHRIGRCDIVLQGSSLAHQIVRLLHSVLLYFFVPYFSLPPLCYVMLPGFGIRH